VVYPGVSYAIAILSIVTSMLGLCPCLMSFAVLAMFTGLACSNATRVATLFLPIALLAMNAEQLMAFNLSGPFFKLQLGYFVFAFLIYVSNKLDKSGYALSVPLIFTCLGIPFGLFGKIKGISELKSYWISNRENNLFKGNPDQFIIQNLRTILIIIAAIYIVGIVFRRLLIIKKTKLASLQVDVREGVAFLVCAILMSTAMLLIPRYTGLENEALSVPSIVLQILLAYIFTRPIAKYEPKEAEVVKESELEKIQLTEEESAGHTDEELAELKKQKLQENKKKKRRKKLIILAVILILLAGAGYYFVNYSGLIYQPSDVSKSEYLGTWYPVYQIDDATFMETHEYDPNIEVGSYSSDGEENYLTLNEDGTYEYYYGGMFGLVTERGNWREIEGGFRLWKDNLASWDFYKFGDYGMAAVISGAKTQNTIVVIYSR